MKIFLSWSGERSKAVAAALNDWLPIVVPGVQPFYSPQITKGAKWSGELDAALEGTQFGVVCLTPENLESTWIHYEAGALSKTGAARIWTLLLELTPGDVPQPLGKFQHTVMERGDLRAMLAEINAQTKGTGGEPRPVAELDRTLDLVWPKLDEAFRKAVAIEVDQPVAVPAAEDGRALSEKLDEVLELLRSEQRTSWPAIDTGTGRVARTLSPLFISSMSDALAIDVVHQLRRSAFATAVSQQRHADASNSVVAEISLAYVEQTLAEAITYLLQNESDIHGEPAPKWSWLRLPTSTTATHRAASPSNVSFRSQRLPRDVLDFTNESPDG